MNHGKLFSIDAILTYDIFSKFQFKSVVFLDLQNAANEIEKTKHHFVIFYSLTESSVFQLRIFRGYTK